MTITIMCPHNIRLDAYFIFIMPIRVVYMLSCRFVSSKEIEVSIIPSLKILAVEAVCGLEESFLCSILVNQVHLLVHHINEILSCGVVHTRWMFFLERFLKTLKDFVRLRARLEASMDKGWIVQEAFVNV